MRARLAGLALVAAATACAHATRKEEAHVDTPRRADEGEGAREVPRDRTRPPVPAAPSALLAQGGGAQLKEALVRRGLLSRASPGDALDDATSAALRKFQQDEGIAATGFPDRETIRRLGLDPQRVYRSTGE